MHPCDCKVGWLCNNDRVVFLHTNIYKGNVVILSTTVRTSGAFEQIVGTLCCTFRREEWKRTKIAPCATIGCPVYSAMIHSIRSIQQAQGALSRYVGMNEPILSVFLFERNTQDIMQQTVLAQTLGT